MNIYVLIIVFLLGAGVTVGINYLSEDNSSDELSPVSETVEDGSTKKTVGSTASDNKPTVVIDEGVGTSISNGLRIDLSDTGLTSVPKYVFERTEIESLDLSQNSLSGALPAEVRHLRNLRILNLSENNFTGVPAEIGQLQNLEVLDLSGNPITGLPYELGNLKKLRILDLRDTAYSAQDLEVIKASLPIGADIQL